MDEEIGTQIPSDSLAEEVIEDLCYKNLEPIEQVRFLYWFVGAQINNERAAIHTLAKYGYKEEGTYESQAAYYTNLAEAFRDMVNRIIRLTQASDRPIHQSRAYAIVIQADIQRTIKELEDLMTKTETLPTEVDLKIFNAPITITPKGE